MRNIKVVLIFILTITAAYTVHGIQQSGKRFDEAGEFYRKRQTAEAIKQYEELVNDGFCSVAVFYNLGNAYLKKGDIGRAILNFERAKIAGPRDSDLNFNLEYARGLMKQYDISYLTGQLNSFLICLTENISFNENVVLIFVLFALCFILILRGLYLKEIRGFVFTLAAIFFLLAVMMVVPGYFKYRNNVHGAIILAKLTDARYEPVEKSNSHFPLYEGNKVFVLRQSDGWLKVKRPDGKIGWVPENTAVKLRPAG